jgi:hypothetical protein
MERRGAKGDFRSNLHRGGSARAVRASAAEQETAVRAAAVLGLGVAGVLGWAYGERVDVLGVDRGVRLALVTAIIAVIADLAVDAVLSAAPPRDERARSALPPLGILLPVVLAGPAAYVAGRILLG